MSTVPLQTEVHVEPTGSLVVALYGEIDTYTAPEVEDLVLTELSTGEPRIILDLRGVTFMGSAGLTAVVVCQRAAAEHAASFALRSPSKRITDLLMLTGLDAVVHVEP